MSWYIFFFLMPHFPEFCLTLFDLQTINEFGYKSASVSEDDIEAYKYVFAQKNAFRGPLNYYRTNLLIAGGVQRKFTNCPPGLYLIAEHDIYISKESGPLLQEYYDNLQFKVIEDTNHFLQQDKPEAVNRVMSKFLSEQLPEQSAQ